MHITSLYVRENLLDKQDVEGVSQSREALRHLEDCPNKLKQIQHSSSFDPVSIEQKVLHNKHQMEELQDEKDVVTHKIEELTPSGSFIYQTPKNSQAKNFGFISSLIMK